MTRLKTSQTKLKAHNQSLAEIAKPNKFIGRSSNPHSSLDGQYLTDFWQSKNRNRWFWKNKTPTLFNKQIYMVQNSCNKFNDKKKLEY